MIVVGAFALGILIGSIPTADLVARLAGHDLRTSGSGNPGTANALAVAGKQVAVTVLLLDIAKGAAAVALGRMAGGDVVGVVSGLLAIAAQVANPWFGFRGGKGLAVAGGVNVAAWPVGFAVGVALAGIGAATLRSVRGAIVALTGYLLVAVVWSFAGLDTAWGVAPDHVWWLAAGVAAITLPKFVLSLIRQVSAE